MSTARICAESSKKQKEFKNLQLDLTCDEQAASIIQLFGDLQPQHKRKANDLSIVVERDFPHRIQSVSLSFQHMFRFKEQELLASSCRLLFGPSTDVPAIKSLIGGRLGCSSNYPLSFYRKDGEEVLCTIHVLDGCCNENSRTLVFVLDTAFQIQEPTSPPISERPGCEVSITGRRRIVDSAEVPTCSLLSEEAELGKAVAIHVQAVRRAAAAAAAARRAARRADESK